MKTIALLLLATTVPDGGVRMVMLPEGTTEGPGLISEETAALEGIGFAISSKLLSKREAPKLRDELKAAYAELKKEHGETPSPVIRTLTVGQTASSFQTIVIAGSDPKRAAVYLHGYGGNFTLQCWMFARAVAPQGYTTVCPSMDSSGRWWEPKGRKIFDATLSWLSKQGKTELILGGLSNGGMGAAALGRTHESKFRALILISGVGEKGPTAIPTLVLHGESDASASFAHAKAYASAAANRALITWPKGSHYAFLYERHSAAKQISDWLGKTLHP